MLHRDIRTINELSTEVVYNDPLTGEVLIGVVGKVEYLNENTAFVYLMSPYDEQNNKVEGNLRYRDIMVFDDRPENEHGWFKDAIKAYR